MAREATARLYDVDEDTVTFKKLNQTKKYDQGIVTFQARKGKLVDLSKLHESVWASRLAHGTRSGLVSLDVEVIGKVVQTSDGLQLEVSDSTAVFSLGESRDKQVAKAYADLQACAEDEQVVKLTGRIDNYKGRWPSLYEKPLPKTRRILVTSFEKVE